MIKYFMELGVKSDKGWQYACLNETDETVRFMMNNGYKTEKADYYWAFVESSDSVFDLRQKMIFR